MEVIEAIYKDGVFKPLKEVHLSENQRVLVSVQTPNNQDVAAWLARAYEYHQKFVAEHGFLPDSTLDIAEDRLRDV